MVGLRFKWLCMYYAAVLKPSYVLEALGRRRVNWHIVSIKLYFLGSPIFTIYSEDESISG